MFDAVLAELVSRVPGARGAVFCDGFGESVTAIGASGRASPSTLNDFELRIAGAQLATPLELMALHARPNIGTVRELTIHGAAETILLQTLPDEYYLVLCIEPGALTARARRELRRTAVTVAREI